MKHQQLGRTEVQVPQIVFGTSSLGNLYESLAPDTTLAISSEWFKNVSAPVAIDTAGKYGAGLALEVIGDNLRALGIAPDQITISNKLGWKRVPLRTPEPTFEPGAWIDLAHDARQSISYEGVLECWEQGNELLGPPYKPHMVSVHDPDEYIAAAESETEKLQRFDDLIGAYRALNELKARGEVQAIGVGLKRWKILSPILKVVELDWVMLANSLTIYRHPQSVLELVESLVDRGIGVINSAVFNAGFLVGGRFLDYRIPSPEDSADRHAFDWRERFLGLCAKLDVSPAAACVQFALSPPGVTAIALNSSDPARVAENVSLVEQGIDPEFWAEAKRIQLIDKDYPYLI